MTTAIPLLTVGNLTTLMMQCLSEDTTDANDESIVIIDGMVRKYAFQKTQIAKYRIDIRNLLMELPTTFRKTDGGGWSAIMACNDRDGRQWGEQIHADDLFGLGQAAGLCSFMLPREFWPTLPSGMPYVMFDDTVPVD